MYVSNPMQSTYYSMQNADNTTPSYKTPEVQSTTSNDQKNRDNNGIWKYDFLDMTKSEMKIAVNQLVQSGQMTMDESSSLVGIMGVLPLSKVGASGTADAEDQSINFIATLKQSISYNKSIDNTTGVKYDNMALSALERLQNKPSSINILA